MRAVIKGALAAALLAGSSLAGTAPAEARDHTGTAILAGIIGLGVGAAIASSDHHDRYYDNGGYDGSYGYDAPANVYAAPAYGYGVTYDRGYYDRGYYHRHHDRDYDRQDHYRHDRDRGDWDHDRGDWDQDRR
ncbi:MAG: hypothetical protein JF628_10650 [Sphingomonas sp.]|nr:hypothetical protein [Sphingomonas sp.]